MKIEKEKTLKITPPDGYEVDKEKSTFDNIVFKKVDDVIIKWDVRHCGVEIKDNGEHFIIGAYQPSYCCSWDDAVRYYSINEPWKLPTVKQLKVLSKHLNKVNKIIREHDRYEISDRLWSYETVDVSLAEYINIRNGRVYYCSKLYNLSVRAVVTL